MSKVSFILFDINQNSKDSIAMKSSGSNNKKQKAEINL